MSFLTQATRYIKRNGISYTLHKVMLRSGEHLLRTYDRKAKKMAPDATALQRQMETVFDNPPTISVVVPVYNTKPIFLTELADSVLNQTYPHFELVLLDGNSVKPETLQTLEALEKRDSRIAVFHSKENLGISGNTNLSIEKATGEYIALLDHDDLLTPDALFEVAHTIVSQQADMIYSDEDKINESSAYLFAPHFKPDFSPDKLRGTNYICHLMVIKKTLLLEVGGLNPACDGSQDHDLALRASEKARYIAHIPKVLYHWRALNTSMSHQNLEKCVASATMAVEGQIKRQGFPALVTTEEMRSHVRYRHNFDTSITFIIEHHGNDEKLHQCMESLGEPPFNNVSMIVLSKHRVAHYETVLYEPDASRYHMLNICARRAPGEVLVFLDSGMRVIDDLELPYLIGRAVQPDAGVVAPTILYQDGSLRHQGYLLGMDTIVKNPQQRHPMSKWGYYAIEHISHNVSAASVAFFAVRKEVFLKAGMFDAGYEHDMGDVDLCLKLSAMGLYHVVIPECQATYFSRMDGPDAIINEKPKEKDAARFLKAYGELKDPFYSPNLSVKGKTYRLK